MVLVFSITDTYYCIRKSGRRYPSLRFQYRLPGGMVAPRFFYFNSPQFERGLVIEMVVAWLGCLGGR